MTRCLHLLPEFVRVAELKSFSAVARELRVTPMAISKNIATLERNLDVRLFHRTTRAVSLTEEGQKLFDTCAGPVQALQRAVNPKDAKTEAGTVRIACVPPFGKAVLIPMLREFANEHPNVRVELSFESRIVDMVKEDFDLGIRAGGAPKGDLIARRLAPLAFVVCGAPQYIITRGVPKSVQELKKHVCLRLGVHSRKPEFEWTLGPVHSPSHASVRGSFSAPDMLALEEGAVNGLGLWLAPLPLALPHFRTGRLVPVLPGALRTGFALYVHYRSRRNLPLRTRVMRDFLIAHANTHPDLQTDPQALCQPFWR